MHSGTYPSQNEYSLWAVAGNITTKVDKALNVLIW